MTAVVFTGPTLSAGEVCAELAAVVLPPAGEGDVYRAALRKPRAIGIIDGHFGASAPVSHKEILWAMSQGIHVFGSAGMGALRAVELAPFGMEGVGEIYEAFLSGEIEDDDEVMVTQGSPENGYPATSEAMVNIRSTLQAAEDQGVVRMEARQRLERLAKGLHYAERSYPVLLERAAAARVPDEDVDRLREFLIGGRIHQKRKDALEMLQVMRERLTQGTRPKPVKVCLEHTHAWEALRRRAGRQSCGPGSHGGTGVLDALIEEVQMAGVYGEVALGAMVRALAIEAARRHGRVVQGALLDEAIEHFRRERGLFDPVQIQRWIEEHQIEDTERFFEDESHVRWAEMEFAADRARRVPDYLRSTGDYGPLVTRARHKKQALEPRWPEGPSLEDLGITEADLWRWYFERYLGRPIPPNLASYARANGFADVGELERAITREFAYVRLGEVPSS